MLRELRIQNFKGWQDTGSIRMAPITLFFGPNSSGKSSIGQFMMMLRQTVDSPDRRAVFYPGGKNSAVQLGSYQEMVYRRDPGNKISFEYSWDLAGSMDIEEPIWGAEFFGRQLTFKAQVGMADKERPSVTLDFFEYHLCEDDKTAFSIKMSRKKGTKDEYQVKSEKYRLKRNMGRAWAPKAPVRFYGFPEEVVAYYQNADFVQELNLRHEKLFRSLQYLEPLRNKSERLYSWGGIEPESVGYFGEHTIGAILAARNRKMNFGYHKSAKAFEELIAGKLKEMGLIDKFEVKPISKQRQEYEVKVCTRGSKDWVDLPDVGFGISQVLPVLVECFYAAHDSIIIMEQPEIHLHPGAQAALADVMIDVINSREGGQNRNIQLIIETHSEHFLRRLQRRIAEERINRDAVAAYFAKADRVPARLEPLEIDEYGNILNWPEHFFGDDMGDITLQAKAAMKKLKKSRSAESADE